MTNIKFPITTIDGMRFKVVVDLQLYQKESVVAACYKYSHLYFIHQTIVSNQVEVILESKDANIVTEDIAKQFCCELIDQQMRYITEEKFGKIRDMIVEEAFKPLNVK